jgi:hypothetical protein
MGLKKKTYLRGTGSACSLQYLNIQYQAIHDFSYISNFPPFTTHHSTFILPCFFRSSALPSLLASSLHFFPGLFPELSFQISGWSEGQIIEHYGV